jgi:hypothetical protein
MYRAPGTGRLAFFKRAFIQAFQYVVQELRTFRTLLIGEVMVAAIVGNHHFNCFTFTFDSGEHTAFTKELRENKDLSAAAGLEPATMY